jgi:transketolase
MASTFGWGRYTGSKGRNIGMHRFGASAPLKDLLKYFEFTVDRVVDEARASIAGK